MGIDKQGQPVRFLFYYYRPFTEWIRILRIIYFFIDGIGLGPAEPESNPFTRYARSYLAPLGAIPPSRSISPGWELCPVDPLLEVSGVPQSATGQTALWTGVNGARIMGQHKTGFPGPTLIRILERESIIKRFVDQGKKASLLNAYGDGYLRMIRHNPRLISASTHLQLASGQPLKTLREAEKQEALFMDITHELLHRLYPEWKERFPRARPRNRGRDLVFMSRSYDLTLFEYFLSDRVGHNRSFSDARRVISILEGFIDGILSELNPDEELLLVTSDHGNLEDLSQSGHTRNPVPLFACGKKADEIHRHVRTLTDIPKLICRLCDVRPPDSVD